MDLKTLGFNDWFAEHATTMLQAGQEIARVLLRVVNFAEHNHGRAPKSNAPTGRIGENGSGAYRGNCPKQFPHEEHSPPSSGDGPSLERAFF
jgi:hypothetical protein